MYFVNILSIFCVSFLLSACSHKIPEQSIDKEISFTQLPKHRAPLLDHLDRTDKTLSDNSAFYSLSSPADALAARLFLIDHATTSLDVQYYIYETDTIGKVITAHLLMAAQRGVKVRILLDDLGTTGKDVHWQKLASHPNVELRLFNPNRFRTFFRNMALLFNVNTLGKRMHNKSLTADGSAAIIGGRNIGDDYYASHSGRLFLDYDILAIGKVVPKIYNAFDLYWNSEESVTTHDLLGYAEQSNFEDYIDDLKKEIKKYNESPSGQAVLNSMFNRKLSQQKLILTVAEDTALYYDHPTKVNSDEEDRSTHITSQIDRELLEVKKDLIIVSPYFIPSDILMKRLKILREKKVNVVIITNSLASTDVFPVYSGYKDDIKPLLEMGVELYELKPDSFKNTLKTKKWANPNYLSLHTKMIIFDDDRIAIGSANIDPRSSKLNTELIMIITSKKLNKEKKLMLHSVINLQNFYQLSWGAYPKEFDDEIIQKGPIWETLEEREEKKYYRPPHAGFWKRLGTDILSFFPIRGYL